MALPPCLDSSTSKKSDKLLRYRRCRPSSLRDQPERQICQSNKSSPYPSLAPRPSKSLAYNKHADSLRSLCATKHDSVPIRSPPRFQCLPPPVFIAIAEALQQIASDSIEGRSAINRFGKVCKSVNEAVEPVLWKDVGWLPQYHWGERLPVNSRKWGFIKRLYVAVTKWDRKQGKNWLSLSRCISLESLTIHIHCSPLQTELVHFPHQLTTFPHLIHLEISRITCGCEDRSEPLSNVYAATKYLRQQTSSNQSILESQTRPGKSFPKLKEMTYIVDERDFAMSFMQILSSKKNRFEKVEKATVKVLGRSNVIPFDFAGEAFPKVRHLVVGGDLDQFSCREDDIEDVVNLSDLYKLKHLQTLDVALGHSLVDDWGLITESSLFDSSSSHPLGIPRATYVSCNSAIIATKRLAVHLPRLAQVSFVYDRYAYDLDELSMEELVELGPEAGYIHVLTMDVIRKMDMGGKVKVKGKGYQEDLMGVRRPWAVEKDTVLGWKGDLEWYQLQGGDAA